MDSMNRSAAGLAGPTISTAGISLTRTAFAGLGVRRGVLLWRRRTRSISSSLPNVTCASDLLAVAAGTTTTGCGVGGSWDDSLLVGAGETVCILSSRVRIVDAG